MSGRETSAEELRRLRCEVKDLAEEAEIARRLAAFDEGGLEGRERIYWFIEAESANFALVTLCRVCRVSRSAFYAWRAGQDGPRDTVVEEAHLANRIFDIWRPAAAGMGRRE